MPNTCLIIGAGLAGLTAARQLLTAGHTVTVLDKARGVGGRLATRRIGTPPHETLFDHGAQYFTARHPDFKTQVAAWQAAGIVAEWGQGFHTSDGENISAQPKTDSDTRYIAPEGMTSIAKALAEGVDVRLDTRVSTIQALENGWRVLSEDGQSWEAASLILTPPVPQSLSLLREVSLPDEARRGLENIAYNPCLALMVRLDAPSQLPAPGGLWFTDGHPFAWMADNQQKGVSAAPGVTIHAGAEFSRAHFDDDTETIAAAMLDIAAPFVGAGVLEYQVQRWRYSQPTATYPEPCLALSLPARLIFAGDAFAGPRVEGAYLSGLAAARAVMGG